MGTTLYAGAAPPDDQPAARHRHGGPTPVRLADPGDRERPDRDDPGSGRRRHEGRRGRDRPVRDQHGRGGPPAVRRSRGAGHARLARPPEPQPRPQLAGASRVHGDDRHGRGRALPDAVRGRPAALARRGCGGGRRSSAAGPDRLRLGREHDRRLPTRDPRRARRARRSTRPPDRPHRRRHPRRRPRRQPDRPLPATPRTPSRSEAVHRLPPRTTLGGARAQPRRLALFLQGCGGNIDRVGIGYEVDCRDTKNRVGLELGGEALKIAAGIRTNTRAGQRRPLGNVPNILFTPWEPVHGDTCARLTATETTQIPLEFDELPSPRGARDSRPLSERVSSGFQRCPGLGGPRRPEVRALGHEARGRSRQQAPDARPPAAGTPVNDILISAMNMEVFFQDPDRDPRPLRRSPTPPSSATRRLFRLPATRRGLPRRDWRDR